MPDIPAVLPDSIITATVTYMYGEAECQHKLHFKTKTGFIDMLAVCVFVMENVIKPHFLPRMVSAVLLRSVECALVSAEIFTSQTVFPEQETVGANAELGAMPIVANVMQLRTGAAGRRGRGRIFFFGFPQAYIEGYHKLSPFALIQMRNLANELESQFAIEGVSPFAMLGVFSHKAYHLTHDEQTSFSPLSFINVQSRLSSMSKRRS